MVKSGPDEASSESLRSLYQIYLASGLASLRQVRVTEAPSTSTPEGLTNVEGSRGASA